MKQSKTLHNQRGIKRTIVRSKTQKRCQQNHQQSLQNRARSTLCQLSENNYHSQLVERKRIFFKKCQKYSCSPWEGKQQQQNRDKNNFNLNITKDDKSVNNLQQTNSNKLPKASEQIMDYKKYTSIFSKIKQARLMKQFNNQQNSLNTTLIIDNQNVTKLRRSSIERKRIINSLYKKLQDSQGIKKKSLNHITSCCLIDSQQQAQIKEDKVIHDHWKKRNRSLKRKSNKKIKQNVIIPNQAYKIQYKSSNPFTKMLYQKYVKAVKILGDAGNLHLL